VEFTPQVKEKCAGLLMFTSVEWDHDFFVLFYGILAITTSMIATASADETETA